MPNIRSAVPSPPDTWVACPALSALRDAEDVWPTLAPLSLTYPGFGTWFQEKVLPGIAAGRRRIFIAGSPTSPLAVGIAKRHDEEKKVSTIWVAHHARGCGLACELLDEMIDWLDDSLPLMTVPAERYVEFVPLVRRFGFAETARLPSLYREGVIEHVFNGSASSFRAA